MNVYKKVQILFPLIFIPLFFLVTPAKAASPDGLGPWADSVFSFHQGLMKNGLAVPNIRSDPAAALGIAENDTIDGHFFSLGFGGNIVLGFDNGISSGVFLVEATNPSPTYPIERAKVEVSENGTVWITAGTVAQDGTVNMPEAISCAKYVRVTDISDPAIMPDDIADGYDVDGVRATGNPCTLTTPTPSPTTTPIPTATPTLAPTAIITPTQTPSNSSSNTSSNNSTSNTSSTSNGSSACTSSGVTTIPNILLARRISPTSIFVSWGPNAGLNNFIVQYGFQNGNWQFTTKVSGFSTTINALPANQSIWIHIAATDNCKDGAFGGAVLVGGTSATNSPGFPNTGTLCSSNPLVPCFPNTGSLNPRLPNTGFGPVSQNNYLIIIAGIVSSVIIFYLARRAYKISTKK